MAVLAVAPKDSDRTDVGQPILNPDRDRPFLRISLIPVGDMLIVSRGMDELVWF